MSKTEKSGREASERTKPLSLHDLRALRAWLYRQGDIGGLLVQIALETGQTSDELVRISPQHINPALKRITTPKVAMLSSRVLRISGNSAKKLRGIPEFKGNATLGSLLATGANKPESQKRALRRYFEQVLRETGLEKRPYTLHSLRVAFALRCFEALNYDLIKVQHALGLKNVVNVVQYLEDHERLISPPSDKDLQSDLLKELEL